MDAQSPSKRFTRGSMSKSNTMQEIKSKLKNNPIKLEGMSAKSKQSNIKIVEGEENAKRKKVVVSGLLEHDEAVKFLGKREPTRIPHMQCYTNIEVMKVLATKLTISQYKEFCGTTCFAQLSSIRRCHVQAQLIRCMSINDRSIQIYDSLRGGALHDSSVENEIKKYAQLVPMYLSKSDFYGKKGIDISSHPNDCGLYVAAYADHISNGNVVPKSFDSEFTRIQYASLLWNYGVQKIQADATSDSEAPERPIRIHRDCDSSEKITIN
ncbi:hypothetical protein KY289_036634 [Solanum tuberosum]|nr:hypothetical protein KY284_036463 [Solanum tuberosum]KAH0636719.1 hypothetical protein KY289_036634 [Solanum tuberosum]